MSLLTATKSQSIGIDIGIGIGIGIGTGIGIILSISAKLPESLPSFQATECYKLRLTAQFILELLPTLILTC